MKKYLFEIISLIIIAVGVYFLFFNHSDVGMFSPKKEEKVADKKVESNHGGEEAGKVKLSLKRVLENSEDADKADFKLTVKNTDDEDIKLEFGSSMKYDFYITDEKDDEIYRESDEKSYMQVVQEIALEPDEQKTFDVALPELDKGDYTITMMLAAKGYSDEKLSADFTVD